MNAKNHWTVQSRALLSGGLRVRGIALLALVLAAPICLSACSSAEINAGFPEVARENASSTGTKIGVARVEDSRDQSAAGEVANTTLLVGPELADYIERTVRNQLAARGWNPVDSLNPRRTSERPPHKTLVVTIQSVTFGDSGIFSLSAESSIDLVFQVYSPGAALVLTRNFSGDCRENIFFTHAGGVAAGGIIAKAADDAVNKAFADAALEQALR